MKRTLYSRYKKRELGGPADSSIKKPNMAGVQTIAGIGSGIVDATGLGNTTVGKGLSMAGQGVAAGATFGPLGAVAGGVLGLGAGLLMGGQQRKMERRAREEGYRNKAISDQNRSAAAIASDSSLVNGYRNSQYFKNGGYLKMRDGGELGKKTLPQARKVDKIPEGYTLEGEENGRKIYRKESARQKPPATTSSTSVPKRKTSTGSTQLKRPSNIPRVTRPAATKVPPQAEVDLDRVYMEDAPVQNTPPQLTDFDPYAYAKGYDGNLFLGADGKTGVWKSRLSGVQGAGLNDQSQENEYVIFPHSERSGKLKGGIDVNTNDWIDRDRGIWSIPSNFPGGIRNNRLEDMRGYANPDPSKAKGLSKYYNLMDGTNEGAYAFLDAASKDPEVTAQYGPLRVDGTLQSNGSGYWSTEQEASRVAQQNGTLGSSAAPVKPKLSFANQNGKYVPYVNGTAVEGQMFDKPEDVQRYLFNYKPAPAKTQTPVTAMKKMGGVITSPIYRKYMTGGRAEPLSSDTVEMKGQAHEQGGIKIPSMRTEVEDGEVIKDDFVFSEELGFAQVVKPLAKAIGKIEQKPDSKQKTNSLKRLNERVQGLAARQEFMKKQYGLN